MLSLKSRNRNFKNTFAEVFALRYLVWDVGFREVRVIQHVQRPLLDGVVQVEVAVQEHEGHVVPTDFPVIG